MAPSKNIKIGPQKSAPPRDAPAGKKMAPTPANPVLAPAKTGK